MDPLSTALGAYAAIKAGVKAGGTSRSSGLRLVNSGTASTKLSIITIKRKTAHSVQPKKKQWTNLLAKKQAEDLEHNLREIVIATRGTVGGKSCSG